MTNVLTKAIWVIDIDKFALQAFNYLAYDCKINGFFVANILFGLLKYYSLSKGVKNVNLWVLCQRFSKIIFEIADKKNVIDNFIWFEKSTSIPSSFFDNY